MRNSLLALLLAPFVFLEAYSQSEEYRPEIHCKHFFYGYPYGTPKTNDLIIRDIYALSNNDKTKFADWVAYRLDVKTISGPTKKRNWNPDPWLDPGETLEPEPNHGDYKGAHDSLKTDRGHQAPLASFDGDDAWFETNYFSNITPQKSNLNQGPWMRLEKKVRKLVESYEVIYVMTGPLYEKEMPKLPNSDEEHTVPSGYWKIILYENSQGYIHACSFIFDQETPRKAKIIDHLVTIDEVEKRSDLDFLWLLPDKKEKAIEANLGKDWAIENLSLEQ